MTIDRIEQLEAAQKERLTFQSDFTMKPFPAYEQAEAAVTELIGIARDLASRSAFTHPAWEDMERTLAEQERLLERLVIKEPWSWSQEGLDDGCMFCDEDRERDTHKPDCVWVAAKKYLDARSKP